MSLWLQPTALRYHCTTRDIIPSFRSLALRNDFVSSLASTCSGLWICRRFSHHFCLTNRIRLFCVFVFWYIALLALLRFQRENTTTKNDELQLAWGVRQFVRPSTWTSPLLLCSNKYLNLSPVLSSLVFVYKLQFTEELYSMGVARPYSHCRACTLLVNGW